MPMQQPVELSIPDAVAALLSAVARDGSVEPALKKRAVGKIMDLLNALAPDEGPGMNEDALFNHLDGYEGGDLNQEGGAAQKMFAEAVERTAQKVGKRLREAQQKRHQVQVDRHFAGKARLDVGRLLEGLPGGSQGSKSGKPLTTDDLMKGL